MSGSTQTHANHDHVHQPGCGHTAIRHEDHTDYLHDGHLHHQASDGTVTEHAIAVSATNPDACTPGHACAGHDAGHRHAPGCGHEAVPHGDHTDYLVAGHLHHPHGDHCDDHGTIAVVTAAKGRRRTICGDAPTHAGSGHRRVRAVLGYTPPQRGTCRACRPSSRAPQLAGTAACSTRCRGPGRGVNLLPARYAWLIAANVVAPLPMAWGSRS